MEFFNIILIGLGIGIIAKLLLFLYRVLLYRIVTGCHGTPRKVDALDKFA